GPPQPPVVTTRSVPPARVGSSALPFSGTAMLPSFESTTRRFLAGSALSFSSNVLPVKRWGSDVEVVVEVGVVVVVVVVGSWQVASQPSPARRLPSSQPSPDSRTPLPQRLPSPHAASQPSPGVQLPSSQVSPGSSTPLLHRVPKTDKGGNGLPHPRCGLGELS